MHDEVSAVESDAKQRLGRQLNVAAKAARGYLDQRLSAAGASFAVWTALSALKAGGPLIQRRLAEMLNVEGPTLTRHLARMEADGLVERRRGSTDRRAAVVRLTGAGEAMYARLSGIVGAGGDVVLHGFSPQEIEQFSGFLDRLTANVAAAPPARRRTPPYADPSVRNQPEI
jgi:MarR family transcriptional regulator, transcriptional regulator for hemolysin